MKKRAVIVHSWSGHPNEDWLPWLKRELESFGFEVLVPRMSRDDEPVIERWDERLEAAIRASDEHTYFIAHSIGCQAVMRYLASRNEKAGGLVFVAGWFALDNLEDEETKETAKPWTDEKTIDFERILNATQNVTVFISDNDPYGQVEENAKKFRDYLHADVHILHDKGHFRTNDGAIELPQARDTILKYSGDKV